MSELTLVGRQVRLRPLSLRLDNKDNHVPSTDDLWIVTGAGLDGFEIRQLQASDLSCKLEPEQVHGFFFDRNGGPHEVGVLRLNGRLMVWPDRVEFGPA